MLHQPYAPSNPLGALSPYRCPSPKSLKTAYNDDQIYCAISSNPTPSPKQTDWLAISHIVSGALGRARHSA